MIDNGHDGESLKPISLATRVPLRWQIHLWSLWVSYVWYCDDVLQSDKFTLTSIETSCPHNSHSYLCTSIPVYGHFLLVTSHPSWHFISTDSLSSGKAFDDTNKRVKRQRLSYPDTEINTNPTNDITSNNSQALHIDPADARMHMLADALGFTPTDPWVH